MGGEGLQWHRVVGGHGGREAAPRPHGIHARRRRTRTDSTEVRAMRVGTGGWLELIHWETERRGCCARFRMVGGTVGARVGGGGGCHGRAGALTDGAWGSIAPGLPVSADMSNPTSMNTEQTQQAQQEQPQPVTNDVSWVDKTISAEITKNTEGARTIGMPVLFGTRYTDKGDIEMALRHCDGIKALADYEQRIAAGGLLHFVACTEQSALPGPNDTLHTVTLLTSADQVLMKAVMAERRIQFRILGVDPADAVGRFTKYSDLRDQLATVNGIIGLTETSTMTTTRFAMVLRSVPAPTLQGMTNAVNAVGTAMGVKPIGMRPKQEKDGNGDFIDKAYTGATEAYFAGARPKKVPLNVPYTASVNCVDEPACLFLKFGHLSLMDAELCRGCGWVLSETGGKHAPECGQAERAAREAAAEQRRAAATGGPSPAEKKAYVAKVRPTGPVRSGGMRRAHAHPTARATPTDPRVRPRQPRRAVGEEDQAGRLLRDLELQLPGPDAEVQQVQLLLPPVHRHQGTRQLRVERLGGHEGRSGGGFDRVGTGEGWVQVRLISAGLRNKSIIACLLTHLPTSIRQPGEPPHRCACSGMQKLRRSESAASAIAVQRLLSVRCDGGSRRRPRCLPVGRPACQRYGRHVGRALRALHARRHVQHSSSTCEPVQQAAAQAGE